MKKKVSAFEYAIMKAAKVPDLENLEPRTQLEELKLRKQNIRDQFSKLKVFETKSMNKAIQYREDGKFYGFYKPDDNKYMDKFSSTHPKEYYDDIKACIAAGKEIINPEVLPRIVNDDGWHIYENEWRILKPGDIFPCPDNIEFEYEFRCKKLSCDSLSCNMELICKHPETVIRLKLKQEVNPVESQEELIRELADDFWKSNGLDVIKSKFTIQRNKS